MTRDPAVVAILAQLALIRLRAEAIEAGILDRPLKRGTLPPVVSRQPVRAAFHLPGAHGRSSKGAA